MSKYQHSNGRVNLSAQDPDIRNLFALYDKIPIEECASFREPTIVQLENTVLSSAFFSTNNMIIIQNAIRNGVF